MTPKLSFTAVEHAAPIDLDAPPEPVYLREGLLVAGGISCKLTGSVDQNAKFTKASFLCENTGTHVGVVVPERIKLLADNGVGFGPLDAQAAVMIEPGRKKGLELRYECRRQLLDANGKQEGDRLLAEIKVDYAQGLFEADWQPVDVPPFELVYDPVLTAEGN